MESVECGDAPVRDGNREKTTREEETDLSGEALDVPVGRDVLDVLEVLGRQALEGIKLPAILLSSRLELFLSRTRRRLRDVDDLLSDLLLGRSVDGLVTVRLGRRTRHAVLGRAGGHQGWVDRVRVLARLRVVVVEMALACLLTADESSSSTDHPGRGVGLLLSRLELGLEVELLVEPDSAFVLELGNLVVGVDELFEGGRVAELEERQLVLGGRCRGARHIDGWMDGWSGVGCC